MGAANDATVCTVITCFCVSQHTKNIWKISDSSVCHIHSWYIYYSFIHSRNGSQNASSWSLEGKRYQSIVINHFLPMLFIYLYVENCPWWSSIFAGPLVPIRCEYGYISLDICHFTSVSNIWNCITIFIYVYTSGAKTIDYDPFSSCIFEIFYAESIY